MAMACSGNAVCAFLGVMVSSSLKVWLRSRALGNCYCKNTSICGLLNICDPAKKSDKVSRDC